MNIGNIKIKGMASLAPMAGMTDRAFREICHDFGAAYFTSEMVSVKGIIYDSKKTFSLMEHSNLEMPFALQLFGSNPQDFYDAVKIISDKFELPDIIDINMGCPATKIVKENSGSALMKTPEICGEIVKSVKAACGLPVTVKIRAGWSEINAPEVAKICALAGADAITIHGRTKTQGYSGVADLEVIKKVKQAVSIPVIGNGDVTSAQSAKRMLETTGCDMVAIGRGAVGRPWIFEEINRWYSSGEENFEISVEEKSKVMKKHVEKMCKYKGEIVGIKESRKHLAAYLKGFQRAAELRKMVFSAQSKEELFEICDSIK